MCAGPWSRRLSLCWCRLTPPRETKSSPCARPYKYEPLQRPSSPNSLSSYDLKSSTFRSRFLFVHKQIKNHFSVPFTIMEYCSASGRLISIGVAEPEKESHVALESYRYDSG